jgi:23S rRNA (pseudouridine1915-N3)-methyltransferase
MPLHVDILAVGRLKEGYWSAAAAEYLKRLTRFAKVTVRELPDQGLRSTGTPEQVLATEAASIRAALPVDSCAIALDSAGEQLTSPGFAELIAQEQNRGFGRVTFIIGGSHGLAHEVKRDAARLLSFGNITLPHNLARIVLLEQLYRAFSILNNSPYHK